MWFKFLYRDEKDKQHMDIVETDTVEEAAVCAEMLCGVVPEKVEVIDELAFVSPLLSKVKP